VLLLPVAFFFSSRSLANYLLDLFPVALLAVLTVMPAPAPAPAVRWRRSWARPASALAIAVAMLGVVVSSVAAFASPPLSLSVRDVYRSEAGGFIGSVVVSVANRTDHRVVPHFMVDTGNDHPSGFWFVPGVPRVVLRPHQSAVFRIRPPSDIDQPPVGTNWLVEAYTTPHSLSTSPVQVWKGWTLTP
jgi:hypothetical protein